MTTLLGIDIGTTRCKAGLFDLSGRALHIASEPTLTRRSTSVPGYAYYDSTELWGIIKDLLRQVTAWQRAHKMEVPGRRRVAAVGIASMAETGLLVDARMGTARTPVLPWFDPLATRQAEQLKQSLDVQGLFLKTGLRPAFKYSLMKILWLKEQDGTLLEGSRWLCAADYIAYRLTGVMATDYSLASRTYAFDLGWKEWDVTNLERLGIPGELFPAAQPSTTVVGWISPDAVGESLAELGLEPGTPVVIAGHDHICGSFTALAAAYQKAGTRGVGTGDAGAGGVSRQGSWNFGDLSGFVFDSIGTAESLLGVLPARRLAEGDYRSGFSFGLHVLPGYLYWLGGLSASGGSLEWLRTMMDDPPLEYKGLNALLEGEARPPTGILYFPYLAGSGSPHSDSLARAAFVGLGASHSRADLYQAVLEGMAYEIEFMRQAAQQVSEMAAARSQPGGLPPQRIIAAGGGTRNRRWMQIRADVFGCPVDVLELEETTLLGAALLAGIAAGIYPGPEAVNVELPVISFEPDSGRHIAYQQIYQDFLALQQPLREHYRGSLQPGHE